MVRAASWANGHPPLVAPEVWRARFPMSDAELGEFCQRWRIRRMFLIGSILREDFSPDSDIDVLVEYESDAHWPWGGYGDIRAELMCSAGRDVDVGDWAGVLEDTNPFRREHVVRTAVPIYAS